MWCPVANVGRPATAASRVATVGRRVPPAVTTAVVVLALAAVNVLRGFVHTDLWLAPVLAIALLVYARLSGLTWSQLGLGRNQVRSGARWGALAIGAVGAVYLAGVLSPTTRSAFLDSRYHLAASAALMTAFVVIPLGTVLFEELAFRSVLWGMLARHVSTVRVVLISSALFGLWHVLPSLHLASANRAVAGAVGGAGSSATVLAVAGAVLVTAAGGVVAGELRRRSGSVLASAGMHWATNSLGVLFGLLAWRLAG